MNCETCKYCFFNQSNGFGWCYYHTSQTQGKFYCNKWEDSFVDPTETRKQAAKAVIALVEDE